MKFEKTSLSVNITVLGGEYAALTESECDKFLRELIEIGMEDSNIFKFVLQFKEAFNNS